jgi:hypothetical protein
MFKGRFISGAEFNGRVPTFTVKVVQIEKLEGDDGKAKDKGIVWFDDTDRGWVLCKTNAMCLAAMFGNDTAGWIGKRVTLFATDVKVGGETVPGIRVRGSPDIDAAKVVEIKLPKKKPLTMKLEPTAKKPA